jgi:serine O-acetyltransferase
MAQVPRPNYRQKAANFFELTLDTLYPIRLCRDHEIEGGFEELTDELGQLLSVNIEPMEPSAAEALLETWPKRLDAIRDELSKDIQAMYEGDPACESTNEVIIAYPGFYAVAAYRIAHELLLAGVPLLPRVITENAHSISGVDIHPGATIGTHLCIDHGTGIVVGETATIGNHVKIYQGVTLGALSVSGRESRGTRRHPTIEDNVVIYAQATILGGETIVGEGSIIGGNVWLTESVPPGSKLYYRPPQAQPCEPC